MTWLSNLMDILEKAGRLLISPHIHTLAPALAHILAWECAPAANGLLVGNVIESFEIWSFSSCAFPSSRRV